jgi:hypothetical protein
MGSAPGSRRFGRRAVILAGLGAAVVAALAAPAGVRWCRESYAIHQLSSPDEDVVREGIATLVRLKSERGAKRVYELGGKAIERSPTFQPPDGDFYTAIFTALNELPLSDGWLLETARSGAAGERRLAIAYIDRRRIKAALPLLRGIAAEGGPLSKPAILCIARLAPTLKLLGTRAIKTGVEARFRLQNETGHDLWYLGSRPASFKSVEGKEGAFNLPNRVETHLLCQGEGVDFSETFAWNELPGSLNVLLCTVSEISGDYGFVRSETVGRPR